MNSQERITPANPFSNPDKMIKPDRKIESIIRLLSSTPKFNNRLA